MKHIFLLFSFLVFVSHSLACDEANRHEFDFWIGDWQVYAGEQLVGNNKITPMLGGCILQEHWVGQAGGSGISLNFFNTALKKWQQHWVWAQGTTTTFTGGKEGTAMVLSADLIGQSGDPYIRRITWTPHPDGTVQQKAEGSKDQGKTWVTFYDFIYRKKAP